MVPTIMFQAPSDGDRQPLALAVDGVREAAHHHHRVGYGEGQEEARQEEEQAQQKGTSYLPIETSRSDSV